MASPQTRPSASKQTYPLTPLASGSIPIKKTASNDSNVNMSVFDLPPSAMDFANDPKLSTIHARHGPTTSNPTKRQPHQQQPSPTSPAASAKGSPTLKRKASAALSLSQDHPHSSISTSAPQPQKASSKPTKAAKKGSGAQNATTTTTKKQAKSSTSKKTARKTAHSIIERRRRIRMNEEFETLKGLVPGCEGVEMHKLEILRSAVAWVRELMGRSGEGEGERSDDDDEDILDRDQVDDPDVDMDVDEPAGDAVDQEIHGFEDNPDNNDEAKNHVYKRDSLTKSTSSHPTPTPTTTIEPTSPRYTAWTAPSPAAMPLPTAASSTRLNTTTITLPPISPSYYTHPTSPIYQSQPTSPHFQGQPTSPHFQGQAASNPKSPPFNPQRHHASAVSPPGSALTSPLLLGQIPSHSSASTTSDADEASAALVMLKSQTSHHRLGSSGSISDIRPLTSRSGPVSTIEDAGKESAARVLSRDGTGRGRAIRVSDLLR